MGVIRWHKLRVSAVTALVSAFLCCGAQHAVAYAEGTLVRLTTTAGVMDLAMEGPHDTVENFLQYVESGAYDNTVWHRVIADFVIQGGGFKASPEGLVPIDIQRPPIVNEAKECGSNTRMSVAMARTNEPHSATSQFFVNLNDNSRMLDASEDNVGYAVFARVVRGEEIVQHIAQVATGSRAHAGATFSHQDVPIDNVTVLKAEVIKDTR